MKFIGSFPNVRGHFKIRTVIPVLIEVPVVPALYKRTYVTPNQDVYFDVNCQFGGAFAANDCLNIQTYDITVNRAPDGANSPSTAIFYEFKKPVHFGYIRPGFTYAAGSGPGTFSNTITEFYNGKAWVLASVFNPNPFSVTRHAYGVATKWRFYSQGGFGYYGNGGLCQLMLT